MKRDNRIDVYKSFTCITRIGQELQQDSSKNLRRKESCKNYKKNQNQPRFSLHGSCQKVRIFFFRQESCTEGMGKES